MRGGANGARLRLAPQRYWEVNNPAELPKVLDALEGVQKQFNDGRSDGNESLPRRPYRSRVGCVGIEEAARRAGHEITVPFTTRPHRCLTGANRRRILALLLEPPRADGFRNYAKRRYTVSAEEMLLDRAQLLTAHRLRK